MPSMTERRHRNVIAVDEAPRTELTKGADFAFARRQLGGPAGGRSIGCSHYEVPPGKTAWPRHWHGANEEAVFVLEGEGRLRIGDDEVTIRGGDYIAMPPGPAHAHQIRNTGDAPLRYLCFSTMNAPEVCGYPDSKKVSVMVGSAPGGSKSERVLEGVFRADATVDYWEGEDGA